MQQFSISIDKVKNKVNFFRSTDKFVLNKRTKTHRERNRALHLCTKVTQGNKTIIKALLVR